MKTSTAFCSNLRASLLALSLAIPGLAFAQTPTWTVRESNATSDFYGVATNGSTTIAVGQYGTRRISTDRGATWAAPSSGGGGGTLMAITWTTGSRFVAVGGSQCAYTDDNGSTWANASTGTGSNYDSMNGVCHYRGTIVAVGDNGSIKTSSDGGLNWTLRTSHTTQHLQGVTAGELYYVAVGDNGAVCRSTDGISWEAFTVEPWGGPYASTNDFLAVTWAGSQFVAVGGDASVQAQWTSPDGSAWTYGRGLEARYAVAWTGTHVIVGGNKFGWWHPAAPPTTWQQAGRPTYNQIRGLVTIPGVAIIAVSMSGGIATTSPDLLTLALSASPAAGGSVSGGGSYPSGSPVTAVATANYGYAFTNWTENSTVVSGSANYPFTLAANRTLVANFTSATPTRIIGLSGPLAFGNVAVGSTSQQTLKISNTGNSPLVVTGLVYPDGFSGTWNGAIPSGSSQNVTVTFAPVTARAYSGNVTVNSNATNDSPATRTIAATGTGIVAGLFVLRS